MIKLGCDESLPSKWRWVEANDVMDVRDGTHDSPKAVDEGIPLVTSKNLVGGKIDFSTCNLISMEDHEAISKRSSVDDGDILYAMIGTIGNPVIVEKSREFSIKNVALFKFTKSTEVYNRYIYHFLNSNLAIRQFQSNSRGGTQKFVSLGNIRSLQIPLPPLDEQKRIAAILDKADAIRRKRQQAIDLADDFLRSVFLDMFGDPVTNPKGWKVKSLGKVFKLSSGQGLTAKNMDTSGEYLVYGGNGVNGRHSEYMFEEPQLIIGRVGVYCGAVHITSPKSWVTDNALFIKEYIEPVNIDYLAQLLELANLNQYAGKAAQPLVSGNRIYPLEMIFPPLEEQRKFSEIKTGFLKLFTKNKGAESKKEDLFNSLSQKAFAGEL